MAGRAQASVERLPAAVRRDLESRFGIDLRAVQLRRPAGTGSNRPVEHGFTVGSQVSLGVGTLRPSEKEDRWLLAHEVAHVIQQARGRAGVSPSPPEQLERAADHAADAVVAGVPRISVDGAAPVGTAQGAQKKKPFANFGDLKPYHKQGRALWVGGQRVSEHEHIRAGVNLRRMTTGPDGSSSYDNAAYRRSLTLTLPREMSLILTRMHMALRDRIKAGTASVNDLQIGTDIDNAIRARELAIAARRQAGRSTADLELITDDLIGLAADGQQHELFHVGRQQKSPWAGMSAHEFRHAKGMDAATFRRTNGTGIEIDDHAPTTTTLPDAEQHESAMRAVIEADRERLDRSPAVQEHRKRMAARAAAQAEAAANAPKPAASMPVAATPEAPESAKVQLPAPVAPVEMAEPMAVPAAKSAEIVEPAAPPEPAATAPAKADAIRESQAPAEHPTTARPLIPTSELETSSSIKAVPASTIPATHADSAVVDSAAKAAPLVETETGTAQHNLAPHETDAHETDAPGRTPASGPSAFVHRGTQVNSILGAIREVQARHDDLVRQGVSPGMAWLRGTGRAALTLAANLRGGKAAAAVNAVNAYEQARGLGEDELDAGASALGTVAGGLATKPTPASVAAEAVNHVAALAGAPEGVQLTTSGAVEALPSTAAVRVLSAGARSIAALGSAGYHTVRSGSSNQGVKALDKLATSFAKGDAGPMIQGLAVMINVGADMAAGDSLARASARAAALGERDSSGQETWSSRTAGKLAGVYLNLTHDPVERYDPAKAAQGKWERRIRRAFGW